MTRIEIKLSDYETLRVKEAMAGVFATYEHHGMMNELQALSASAESFLGQMMEYEQARQGQPNKGRSDMNFMLDEFALVGLVEVLDMALPHEEQKTHLAPDKKARRVQALRSVALKVSEGIDVLSRLKQGLKDGTFRILGDDGSWL